MFQITLAAARVNAGMSQKDAAKKLGVSNKTLASWERGQYFPNAQKIDRICELYNIPVDNLIFLPRNNA